MRQTTKRSLLRALCAAPILALCACGGGGGATNALPSGSTPLAAGKAVVKIALTVPPATLQVHRRSPQYIAPTTKGFGFDFATTSSALNSAQPTVAVNFSNPAAPTIAVDTYGGSTVSCTIAPDGSATCAFALTVPTSTTPYILQVSTFDSAPSSTGTTFNSADLLSQMLTSVSVANGSPTTPIPLILNGVPASTELVPMPNQVHLQPNGGGYTLVGMTPVQAHIYALDRDGNTIVGDGAPQICVQSPIDAATSAPYVSVTVSSPGTGTGPSGQTCDNAPTTAPTWTLQTKSWSASPLSLTLNAVASGSSPTGGTGTAATSSVSLSEEQEVWVGASNTGAVVNLEGYAYTPGTSATPGILDPILTDTATFAGGTTVRGGALDPKTGNPWLPVVLYPGTYSLEDFSPQEGSVQLATTNAIGGTGSGALTIDPNLNNPWETAIDGDDRLWMSDQQYYTSNPTTSPSIVPYQLGSGTSPILLSSQIIATAAPSPAYDGVVVDPGTEGDGRPATLWSSAQSGTSPSTQTLLAYNIASSSALPTPINVSGFSGNLTSNYGGGIAEDEQGKLYIYSATGSTSLMYIYGTSYSAASGAYTVTSITGSPVTLATGGASNIYSIAATYPNASNGFNLLVAGHYAAPPGLYECTGAPSPLSCPSAPFASNPNLSNASSVVVAP